MNVPSQDLLQQSTLSTSSEPKAKYYQLSQVEFKKYVFFTLTYDGQQTIPSTYYWHKIATDYNRFIQKLRRLHNSPIQAIRSFESHASGNPHIHILARFPTVLTIHNEKYFDRALYDKWKQLWTFGYLDAKTTLSSGSLPIRYLLKYLSKHTSTYKSLWRNYYKCLNVSNTNTNSVTNPTTGKSSTSVDAVDTVESLPPKELATLLFCKSFKVKQLSWTRAFFNCGAKGFSSPSGQTLLTPA